jgi:hypothetical protein
VRQSAAPIGKRLAHLGAPVVFPHRRRLAQARVLRLPGGNSAKEFFSVGTLQRAQYA